MSSCDFSIANVGVTTEVKHLLGVSLGGVLYISFSLTSKALR